MNRFGIIADEISKKYFKIIHNIVSKKLNYESSVEEIEVSKIEDLETCIEYLKNGYYKAIIIDNRFCDFMYRYVDRLSEKAAMFNEINMVTIEDGEVVGYNTNYSSFLEALLINDINPINLNVVIIGSERSSKLAQHVLKDLKVNNIFVLSNKETNRSNSPKVRYINGLEISKLRNIDMIINTTSVGSFPIENELPILENNMIDVKYAMDMNYSPRNTTFLMAYRRKKAYTIDGLYIQIAKILKSFTIWLNDKSIYSPSIIEEIYKEVIEGI